MAKKEKIVEKIASAEADILKTYGNVLVAAKSLKERNYQYIPTCLSMDIAINGGMLEGTVMNINGLKKCGKTTKILQILANAQKMGKECFYVDAEGRLQSDLMDCIEGLDQEKLQVIRSTQEKFLTAEDYLRIIVSLFKAKPNIVVVLDSIAALMPESAYSVQIGESRRMAGVPTLLYDFFKLSPIIEANRSNLIAISHMQANPGGYGPSLRAVGGNAMGYFSSYIIECTSSSEIPKDDEDKIGRESTFKVVHCATGKPGSKYTFHIRYGEGYDRYKDIANIAEEIGLVTKAGAWYKFTPEGKEEVSCQGQENLIEYLKNNKDIAQELENKIRELCIESNRPEGESDKS